LSPTGYQSIQSRRSQVGLLLLLSPGQFLFNLLLLQPSSGQLLLHLLLLKLSPCKLLLNLLLLYPPSGQLLLDLLLLLLSPAQLFPHLLLLELSPRKLGLQLTQLGRSCLSGLRNYTDLCWGRTRGRRHRSPSALCHQSSERTCHRRSRLGGRSSH